MLLLHNSQLSSTMIKLELCARFCTEHVTSVFSYKTQKPYKVPTDNNSRQK